MQSTVAEVGFRNLEGFLHLSRLGVSEAVHLRWFKDPIADRKLTCTLLALAALFCACTRSGFGLLTAPDAQFGEDVPSITDAAGGEDAAVSCPGGCDVATGFDFPFAMIEHAGTIYVAEWSGGGIWSFPLAGGIPTRLFDAGQGVWTLATDGAYLFWSHDAGISRAALDGASAAVWLTVDAPRGIAASDGWLYWASSNGGVFRALIADGTIETLLTGEAFNRIAVAGDSVFVSRYASDGVIARVATTGGPMQTLASGQDGPWGITVADGYVYWLNHTAGELARTLVAGGAVEILATAATGLHELVFDSGEIFIANDLSGELLRFGADGQLRVHASGVGSPKHLFVSGGFIYFTDRTSNRIARVAR
jgi:hypothetical protein